MSRARRCRRALFRAFASTALAAAAVVFTASPGACGDPAYVNGFPRSREFFPLGVWQQPPRTAAEYKAIGINTFVGLWEGPTEAQLAELARSGLYVVAEQNEVGLTSPNRGVIRGWMQGDEPDNAQAPISGLGPYSPCIPAAEVARRSQAMKARNLTRPVFVNFGRGVADPLWPGRGTCTGDEKYYDVAVKGADIVGFDIYPVGSDTPRVKGKLEYVAHGVVNLLRRTSPGQTVWSAIETTALDPARPVKPEEVRAEVWMALIHGARGIVYFAHEWAGGLREDGIFRHPEIVREVARINHTIAALAPVVNSADRPDRVTVAAPVPIATMVKEQSDGIYLFAVAMENRPATARFAIRGLSNADVSVLDEARNVTVKDGTLEDRFEGYAVHLYKIPVPTGARGPAADQAG
jgi:hypothetical protein